jgi:hypothetical protein
MTAYQLVLFSQAAMYSGNKKGTHRIGKSLLFIWLRGEDLNL